MKTMTAKVRRSSVFLKRSPAAELLSSTVDAKMDYEAANRFPFGIWPATIRVFL
jgi:hypothetical protein